MDPEKAGSIRNEKGQFVPGVSGNPAGKPKGATSITAAIRGFLENNPDKFEELFMDYIQDKKHRDLLWRMIDGNPRNATDVTSGGKPIPILGSVPAHDGDNKDSEAQ